MTLDQTALAPRMAHIKPFVVMEIQRRAFELEATGRNIIHLEIGQPDFGAPPSVVTAATPGGAFSFSNVEPGSYTLTSSGAGVTTRIVLIEVIRGIDLLKNVDLAAT